MARSSAEGVAEEMSWLRVGFGDASPCRLSGAFRPARLSGGGL